MSLLSNRVAKLEDSYYDPECDPWRGVPEQAVRGIDPLVTLGLDRLSPVEQARRAERLKRSPIKHDRDIRDNRDA